MILNVANIDRQSFIAKFSSVFEFLSAVKVNHCSDFAHCTRYTCTPFSAESYKSQLSMD